MEKDLVDLLKIAIEQELVEYENKKVVKSRKQYNHDYYMQVTKEKRRKARTEKHKR